MAIPLLVLAAFFAGEPSSMAAAASPAAPATLSLEITYIANEGFLITAGSDRVLVDALFSEGYGTYLTPSWSTKRKLSKASAPFDDIDLILVSHAHDDHFDPKMVVAHLKRNPKTICVAPQQAVDKMKEEKDFEAVAGQIDAATPGHGTVISKTIGDIELKVFGMRHAPYMENGVNRHRDVQNLGFLVNTGGVRWCHDGDAVFDLDDEFIRSSGIGQETIDVLFTGYYDLSENTQHLVNDVFKFQYVVAMHIPEKDVDKMAYVFQGAFPRGVVFTESMKTETATIVRPDRNAQEAETTR